MTHEPDSQPSTSYEQLHLQATCKGHKNGVTGIQFSPRDDVIASVSADASVRLWRLQDGSATGPSTSMTHAAGINDVSWNAQGNYLATASDDVTAKIWDAATGECLCTLANHTNYVFCCQFNPMGNILVSKQCITLACHARNGSPVAVAAASKHPYKSLYVPFVSVGHSAYHSRRSISA